MRSFDNHGRATLFGVYSECQSEMQEAYEKIPNKQNNMKAISYRLFSQVVRMYFTIAFKILITGVPFPLLNKFGILNVVKAKCIRYNPFRISFYTDESGNRIREKVKIKLKNGYWYFVFWDAPKRFRQYRFNIDRKYKRAYMKLVEDGYDYLDYSLDKYGRNASTEYIQHIK